MKKLLLLLSFALISTFCHSQTVNKVYKSVYVSYYNGDWHDEKTMFPLDMYVTINKNSITINNDDKTSVMTYGDCDKKVFERHISYTWNAIDKDGERCSFMMKLDRYGKGEVNSIYYFDKGIGFLYYIDNE